MRGARAAEEVGHRHGRGSCPYRTRRARRPPSRDPDGRGRRGPRRPLRDRRPRRPRPRPPHRPPHRPGPHPRDHGQLPGGDAALLPGAPRAGGLPGAGAGDADGQRGPALRPGDLPGRDPRRRRRGALAARGGVRHDHPVGLLERRDARHPLRRDPPRPGPARAGVPRQPVGAAAVDEAARRRVRRPARLRRPDGAGAAGDRRRPRRARGRPPGDRRAEPRPHHPAGRQRGLHVPHVVALPRPGGHLGDGLPPDRPGVGADPAGAGHRGRGRVLRGGRRPGAASPGRPATPT